MIKDTLTKVLLMRKEELLFVVDREGTGEVSTYGAHYQSLRGRYRAQREEWGMNCHLRGAGADWAGQGLLSLGAGGGQGIREVRLAPLLFSTSSVSGIQG